MSANKVECETITCDNCGDTYENHSGFTVFFFSSDAHPEDDDWYVDNDTHYCPDCHTIDDDDNLIIDESRKEGSDV